MMAYTEGNTNRECCFIWGRWWGFDGWERIKSRLSRKKLRPQQKMAHRVYQVWCVPTCEWLATTDPSRLTALRLAASKLCSALPRLHVHNSPSPEAVCL